MCLSVLGVEVDPLLEIPPHTVGPLGVPKADFWEEQYALVHEPFCQAVLDIVASIRGHLEGTAKGVRGGEAFLRCQVLHKPLHLPCGHNLPWGIRVLEDGPRQHLIPFIKV